MSDPPCAGVVAAGSPGARGTRAPPPRGERRHRAFLSPHSSPRETSVLPEPHVCCVCKREVVYTDCLPAVCFGCREAEQIVKAPGELPTPDVTVTPTPSLRESK